MVENRISPSSARLISTLDKYTRYIRFKAESDHYVAVICSSISDEDLDVIRTANMKAWKFTDKQNAMRSIRRLNKDVPIYAAADEINLSDN